MKKKKRQIILGVAAFLVLGILYIGVNQQKTNGEVVTEEFSDTGDDLSVQTDSDGEKAKAGEVYIHICGEVKKPGVYIFEKEPHIIDVVEKAGGFTKKADQKSVNLAETVSDGTQVIISAKEKKKTVSGSSQTDAGSDKININTATKEELMTLSGIGESKASQILSYRETNGTFQKIEDVMNISGIKEGVFSKIKDYITV